MILNDPMLKILTHHARSCFKFKCEPWKIMYDFKSGKMSLMQDLTRSLMLPSKILQKHKCYIARC